VTYLKRRLPHCLPCSAIGSTTHVRIGLSHKFVISNAVVESDALLADAVAGTGLLRYRRTTVSERAWAGELASGLMVSDHWRTFT